MEVIIIGIVLYLLTRKKEVGKIISRDPVTGNVVREIVDPATGKVIFVKGKTPVNVDKYKRAIVD
jgi:hypothetical protein